MQMINSPTTIAKNINVVMNIPEPMKSKMHSAMFNPSNAEDTFIQSTRKQRIFKNS